METPYKNSISAPWYASRALWCWVGLFILYSLLYGYRLNYPASLYFDEFYDIPTARQFIQQTEILDTNHPPLGKIWIALSILILGDHPIAWRLPSFLFGFGNLLLTYRIAILLSASKRAALFTILILFFDCLSFSQARIGMFNAATVFFLLWSVLIMGEHALQSKRSRFFSFLFSGIFWGLAMATKWLSLWTIPVYILLILHIRKSSSSERSIFKQTFFWFVLPAVFVYFSTFTVITMMPGYKWTAPFFYQLHMIEYNLTVKAVHEFQSPWWSWPLVIRPVWYYARHQSYISVLAHQKTSAIVAMGNVFFFWLFPIFIGFVLRRFLKTRAVQDMVVLAGFVFNWILWGFFSRQLFIHHFYGAIPYLAISAGLFLDHIWEKGRTFKTLVSIYLIIVIAFFAFWYPMMNGSWVDSKFVQHHIWLRSWWKPIAYART